MNKHDKQEACELVAREAQLLDEGDWDTWLELYEENATFWVPMWRDENEPTEDPTRELSLIYLEGRRLLAERVFRVRSGRSVASSPTPRTAHTVTGSIATASHDEKVTVKSAWSSFVYDHKQAQLITYAGRYEHVLVRRDDRFRILCKKVVIINDQLESKVDFFYI